MNDGLRMVVVAIGRGGGRHLGVIDHAATLVCSKHAPACTYTCDNAWCDAASQCMVLNLQLMNNPMNNPDSMKHSCACAHVPYMQFRWQCKAGHQM